jgi:hypothetical protein
MLISVDNKQNFHLTQLHEDMASNNNFNNINNTFGSTFLLSSLCQFLTLFI